MKKPRRTSQERKGRNAAGSAGTPLSSHPIKRSPQSNTAEDKQQQLQDLIDLLKRNNLTELEWECDTYRVRLRYDTELKPSLVPSAELVRTAPSTAAELTNANPVADTPGLVTITSPIVGTFYRSPSPDADPYVEENDMVKKGQVLCIVEAMKLMNEIESEVDGRIVKLLVESAKPVEYGQPLYLIEPSTGA